MVISTDFVRGRPRQVVIVNGEMVSDSSVLLQKWDQHFGGVASSRIADVKELKELKVSVDGLVPLSLNNEECLLDVPFTSDEVKAAILVG